jgi:hypothetical protein
MSRAPVPYENQIIGAFIFAMGHVSGRLRPQSITAANLLQQTPMDPTFGDFVAGYEYCVAIEFKRTQDDLPSESEKWDEKGLATYLSRSDLMQIAEQGHLVAFFEPEDRTIFTCPYPTALQARASFIAIDAMQVIEELCAGVTRGVSPLVLEPYLLEVARLRKGTPPSGEHEPDGLRSGVAGGSLKSKPWLAIAHNAKGEFSLRTATSLAELLSVDATPPTADLQKRLRLRRSRQRSSLDGKKLTPG